MTLTEFLTANNSISIIGSGITAVVSLQLFFLKWLKDSFDRLSNALKDQGSQMYEWLKDHEDKDQNRHEANLARFEKINVTLAKIDNTHGRTLHN